MRNQILQRPDWYGVPVVLGEWFVVRKDGRVARCVLQTHQFGWELRLMAGEELLQSATCLSQDDVFTTGEQWRAAMLAKGWQ